MDSKPKGISRATADGLYLGLGGGSLQGGLHFLNASKITNLGNPQTATDAANKRYMDSKVSRGSGITQTKADARYLQKIGGTLSGRVNMSNNLIIGLADPTGAAGAATKGYVKLAICCG